VIDRFFARAATFVLCTSAICRADDNQADQTWVLPRSSEDVFSGVIRDVNQEHRLGEGISVTDIRIEREHATIVLAGPGEPPNVSVILTHPAKPDSWAHWFDRHTEPAAASGPLAMAVVKLGPVLDARFSSDPWMVAVALPRAVERTHFPRDGYRVHSRRRIVGGAAASLALLLGLALWLAASTRAER
jgi:hypothetical protein